VHSQGNLALQCFEVGDIAHLGLRCEFHQLQTVVNLQLDGLGFHGLTLQIASQDIVHFTEALMALKAVVLDHCFRGWSSPHIGLSKKAQCHDEDKIDQFPFSHRLSSSFIVSLYFIAAGFLEPTSSLFVSF
jgi:hypothetical protein